MIIISLSFALIYVLVHIAAVYYNPDMLHGDGHCQPDWTAIASPVTIGMANGLLTLSLGMFLVEEGFNVGIAAPSVLVSVFFIYIIGQILILLLGQLELYANRRYLLSIPGCDAKVGGAEPDLWSIVSSISGFLSISAGLTVLAVLESYISRVMAAMKDRLGSEATLHSNRARLLTYAAGASIFLAVVKTLLSTVLDSEGAKSAVTIFTLVLEAVIVGWSFMITCGWPRRRSPAPSQS